MLDITSAGPDAGQAIIDEFQRGFTWLADPQRVTIAAVHGHAIGAGFQLALACDIRVASEDAQFTMAETSLGLVPDLTGTLPLVRAVGYDPCGGDLPHRASSARRGGPTHRVGQLCRGA